MRRCGGRSRGQDMPFDQLHHQQIPVRVCSNSIWQLCRDRHVSLPRHGLSTDLQSERVIALIMKTTIAISPRRAAHFPAIARM